MTTRFVSPSKNAIHDAISKMRKSMFWTGITMTLIGIAALAMPLLSSVVVEIFVGWLLTISGIVSVVGAFSLRGTVLFIWQVLAGLITLAAGVLLLLFPVQGLIALTLLVAVIFLLTGAAQCAFAFWMRPAPGWGWALLSAIVSVLLGGFIFATLPEASAVVLGLFVGIDFVSTGVAFVLISRSVVRP